MVTKKPIYYCLLCGTKEPSQIYFAIDLVLINLGKKHHGDSEKLRFVEKGHMLY